MATRLEYRNRLKDKVLGLEDEGYGDFEYTDAEFNTFLELAVARLYPAVYTRLSEDDLPVTNYGTLLLGEVETDFAESVYLVEDATERDTVTGWKVRPGKLIGLSTEFTKAVNVYYHDAFLLPADETTDAGIPAKYTPLVVLGALIEALEARHDTGVRGEPPPTGQHSETQLIDRLLSRYDSLKSDLAMSLPGIQV